MIEIRNKTPGPVQLIVRSFSHRRKHARAFTCQNIPGLKTIYLKDERAVDKYIKLAEKEGLITARYIPNTDRQKEE